MTTTRTNWLILLVAVLLLAAPGGAPQAHAVEVAGVTLSDTVQLVDEGVTLVLNGAGVRKKFVVKVYVGGLYLLEKKSDPQEVLDDPNPKRMVMHFLHKEVSAEKIVQGWNDGFQRNQDATEMAALQGRLEAFNALFTTVRKGDRIEIDLLVRRGTVVSLNGRELGSVAGEDFARALLEAWLGSSPADKSLKKSLLGR